MVRNIKNLWVSTEINELSEVYCWTKIGQSSSCFSPSAQKIKVFQAKQFEARISLHIFFI